MNNREPILLSRFQTEASRVRDTQMRRQYRISLVLVAVLLAATLGAVVSMTPRNTGVTETTVKGISLTRAS